MAALVAAALVATTAHAATMHPVYLTAPADTLADGTLAPCASYVAERRYGGTSVWVNANLYGGPGPALSPAVPNQPGTPDTVFVSVTTDPFYVNGGLLAGGAELRVAGVGHSGRAPWSNHVAMAYVPDTVAAAVAIRQRVGMVKAQAGPGMMAVAFAYGDTVPHEVWHFERVQAAFCLEISRSYGYVCRRGERDSTGWCDP